MEENVRKAKMDYLLSKKTGYDFYDLALIVELLRAPGGCPWDIEQTHKSIRNDFIEETYEVIEAIDTEDPKLLREELGDVLLQVVFHAQLEKEQGSFDISGVTNDICAKLIHRHPHVFGNVTAEDTATVLSNWEQIKGEEKQRVTVTDKLNAIPPMLPALMRAAKVGKKAKMFDFASADEVFDKLDEETAEVREAISGGDADRIDEEIGDLLLTVTSLSRKTGVDPEGALFRATNKFIRRFSAVEQEVLASGRTMEQVDVEELNRIWDKVKQNY